MAKIVVDANVIISAAFGGKPLEAVVRALEDHDVYLSEAVAQELLGVLAGLSKKLSEDQISFLNEKIQEFLTLTAHISPASRVVLSRDPRDDHYLSFCKEIGAEFLVTGNKDLLSISQDKLEAHGVSCKVFSPQEFFEYGS